MKNFNNILVVRKLNGETPPQQYFTNKLIERLRTSNISVNVVGDTDTPTLDRTIRTLILAIGGDGTVLEAMRISAASDQAPVLGVNVGRVGFLCDINGTDYHVGSALDAILAIQESPDVQHDLRFPLLGEVVVGRYTLEAPALHKTGFAFNEISVFGQNRGMVRYRVMMNNKIIIQKHSSLGVLFSTPTGSTAFARSGGGAVINPAVMDVLQIVPISPQDRNQGPLLIPFSTLDLLEVTVWGKDGVIIVDGQTHCDLTQASTLTIRRSSSAAMLLHPYNWTFEDKL
jgi:NAD+ kinase